MHWTGQDFKGRNGGGAQEPDDRGHGRTKEEIGRRREERFENQEGGSQSQRQTVLRSETGDELKEKVRAGRTRSDVG